MNHTPRCRACRDPLPADTPTWKTLCRECYIEAKKAEHEELLRENVELKVQLELASRQPAIEPQMIRALLQLCHPDKHGNSANATRATQWLLTLRRERAEAAR